MSTKVEKSIKKCQEEVKIELIEDTLLLYNEYRENLEAQLHSQAHALHQVHEQEQLHAQEFESHPAAEVVATGNFHPEHYTRHGFEEGGDIHEEGNRKLTTHAMTRKRRDASNTEWFHPTLISHEDKWIAGVSFP